MSTVPISNRAKLPRLVVTLGEPAGIGPELVVRMAQCSFQGQIILLGDASLLSDTAKKLGLELNLTSVDWSAEPVCHTPNHLFIEQHDLAVKVTPGQLDLKNAPFVLNTLNRASELALTGLVDAIVTAPVHKAHLNRIDSSFKGHTEYFAERAQVDRVVMMLATNELRICLATTHLPLSQVAAAITRQSLSQVVEVIYTAMESFGVSQLRLAVCGLNPHAGENGLLGAEEQQVIGPVIEKFQAMDKSISGPYPADTLFIKEKRNQFDVCLAMYHDQGLPVVKASGFGQCANITLGLPYIRTSVDHGTALDIAATYSANPDSLNYAINYALALLNGKLPS